MEVRPSRSSGHILPYRRPSSRIQPGISELGREAEIRVYHDVRGSLVHTRTRSRRKNRRACVMVLPTADKACRSSRRVATWTGSQGTMASTTSSGPPQPSRSARGLRSGFVLDRWREAAGDGLAGHDPPEARWQGLGIEDLDRGERAGTDGGNGRYASHPCALREAARLVGHGVPGVRLSKWPVRASARDRRDQQGRTRPQPRAPSRRSVTKERTSSRSQ